MSTVEYIAILASILLGLAIADQATSLHRLIRAGSKVRWHWLSVLLAIIVLLTVLQFWWGSYRRWTETETIGEFLIPMAQLLLLFLLASAALPDDNRLGLAILRRLDRLAETGMTVSTIGQRSVFPGAGRGPWQREAAASQRLGPGLRRGTFDWQQAIDGLRIGDDSAVAKALALLESHEVEEVEGPPVSFGREAGEPEEIDLSPRCWKDDEDVWMTSFPPPPGFTGYQTCDWGNPGTVYERECTADEVAILEADAADALAHERSEEEALRDQWFALLREELDAPPPLNTPPSR